MQTSDAAGTAAPTIAETLAKLGTDDKTGLTDAEVQERLKKYGPNALVGETEKRVCRFVGIFLGTDSMFMSSQGRLVPPLPWGIIGLVRAYNIVWMMVQDIVKLGLYRILDPAHSWERPLFEPLRVPMPDRQKVVR